MAILERNTRNIDNRYWNPGAEAFPVKNRYTAGVAGQRFFEELKENGRLFGSRCEDCNITYVPARIYCERCFNRLADKDWVDVGTEGTIFSFTFVHETKSGETKESPSLIAAIKIADSLLIHRLGETDEDSLQIGIRVKAKLKPQAKRKGGIEDIDYFKPL